jgi:hypothetical protein
MPKGTFKVGGPGPYRAVFFGGPKDGEEFVFPPDVPGLRKGHVPGAYVQGLRQVMGKGDKVPSLVYELAIRRGRPIRSGRPGGYRYDFAGYQDVEV